MTLDNNSKDLLKRLYESTPELNQEKNEARHGDIFWAKYYNSSNVIRESPVLIVSNDGDKEDVIVLKGTRNVERPDYDVQLDISFVNARNKTKYKTMAFRTNKITTIQRSDLSNKCSFDWGLNPDKHEEVIKKLSSSLGIS